MSNKSRTICLASILAIFLMSLPCVYFLTIQEYVRLAVLGVFILSLLLYYRKDFSKALWRRAAFVNVPFEANTKYTMEAKVQFTSKCPVLTVTCNGVKFGCMLPELKRGFYAGITGCEGINHFYDFKLTK